jgi:hypothetical protein
MIISQIIVSRSFLSQKTKGASITVCAHSHAMSRGAFFASVSHYFDRAAAYSGEAPGLLEQVKSYSAVFRMRFPVRKDDGIFPQSRHMVQQPS